MKHPDDPYDYHVRCAFNFKSHENNKLLVEHRLQQLLRLLPGVEVDVTVAARPIGATAESTD